MPSINPHTKKRKSRLIEPHSTFLISNFDLLSFRSIAYSYDLISCPWPPHDEAHFRNAAQGQSLIVAKSALTRPFCALGSNEPVKIVNIVNINTNTLFVDSCAPFSRMKICINWKYCHQHKHFCASRGLEKTPPKHVIKTHAKLHSSRKYLSYCYLSKLNVLWILFKDLAFFVCFMALLFAVIQIWMAQSSMKKHRILLFQHLDSFFFSTNRRFPKIVIVDGVDLVNGLVSCPTRLSSYFNIQRGI